MSHALTWVQTKILHEQISKKNIKGVGTVKNNVQHNF